jgi:uncharacterized protein DUF3455
MHGIISRLPRRARIGLAVLTLLAGCAGEAPLSTHDGAVAATMGSGNNRAVDLGGCDSLDVPAGSHLAAQLYAEGVQIYRWDGTKWVFVAPSARLFPTPEASGEVGTHYAGPTWESVSGSKVVGSVIRRCTPDASAIPWLLLSGVSSGGPGIFQGITLVQRLNTTGGIAPSQPGSVMGELANVPYTAEYQFYRDE